MGRARRILSNDSALDCLLRARFNLALRKASSRAGVCGPNKSTSCESLCFYAPERNGETQVCY